MMKKLYRMVALALAAAALCFSLTGCGISDFFKNKDNKTQDDPNASPSTASTATPRTMRDALYPRILRQTRGMWAAYCIPPAQRGGPKGFA